MGIKKYDEEFKQNVLAMYKTGKNPRDIRRELEIAKSTFWGWIADDKAQAESRLSSPEKGGNSYEERLKKEVDDLRLENAILKKAVAIFSKTKL
jgi:transposase